MKALLRPCGLSTKSLLGHFCRTSEALPELVSFPTSGALFHVYRYEFAFICGLDCPTHGLLLIVHLVHQILHLLLELSLLPVHLVFDALQILQGYLELVLSLLKCVVQVSLLSLQVRQVRLGLLQEHSHVLALVLGYLDLGILVHQQFLDVEQFFIGQY